MVSPFRIRTRPRGTVAQPTLSGSPSTTATQNSAYTPFTPTLSGGSGGGAYSLRSGALPTGMSLDTQTGTISGTPTVAGSFNNIGVRYVDNGGRIADLPAFSLTVAANSANVPDISPNPLIYNGTAGSGGTQTATAPRTGGLTPDMTGWKPMAAIAELFKPFQTITGDTIVGWSVEFGGRAHSFDVWCEGNGWTNVPRKTWQIRTDANGNSVVQYGYHVRYKASTHLSLWPNTLAYLYVRVTPTDTTNYGTKIAGPFPLNVRTTEFDVVKTFTRTAGLGADFDGQDAIQKCLIYMQTHQTQFVKFECRETAQYRVRPPQSGAWLDTNTQPIVFAARSDITCTLGDGSLQGSDYVSEFGHNGIVIRGMNMKVDLSLLGIKASTAYTVALKLSATRDRLHFDGCDIFHGNGEGVSGSAASRGITGSGAGLLINGQQPAQFWLYLSNCMNHDVTFFDCHAHDLCAYGLGFSRLVLNCTVERVSGSCYESPGHVIGGSADSVGGILTDVRTYKHALDITFTPTGGATQAYIERPLNNGNPSDFCLYLNNQSISATLSGTNLTVASVSGVTLAVGDHLGLPGTTDFSNMKIASQTSGTAGGAGVYVITVTKQTSNIDWAVAKTLYVAKAGTAYVIPITGSTTCAALATSINAVNGFSATADGSQIRPATYLTYHNGTIQVSNPLFTSALPSNSISLDTIFDAHCDLFVNNGTYREGFIWSFHTAYNLVSTAWISIGDGTQVDCYIANLEAHDTTYEWGQANPSQADLAAQNPSYGGGKFYNLCLDNCTLTGQLGAIVLGGQFDANCHYNRFAVPKISWSNGIQDVDMAFYGLIVNYNTTNSLIAGATGGNLCRLMGYGSGGTVVAESTYLNTTSLVPVAGQALVLSDATKSGSRCLAADNDNSATGNYGWNLVA